MILVLAKGEQNSEMYNYILVYPHLLSLNNLLSASKSGNEEFAASLSKWILKEVGVLRINAVTHHIIGQKEPPHEYTIMEDVVSQNYP